MDLSKWKHGLKVALHTVMVYAILAVLFLALVKMYYLFKRYLS